MIVWHFEHATGTIDFDHGEAIELIITKNRNQIVKQFQNRKHIIYSKGVAWLSFDIASESLSKMEELRALSGQDVNFYYKYHEDQEEYKTIHIDKNIQYIYASGYQLAGATIKLKMIETVKIDPFVYPGQAGLLLMRALI